jgi:hypothetical protein
MTFGVIAGNRGLQQAGVPESLTARHTVKPDSELFRKYLDWEIARHES